MLAWILASVCVAAGVAMLRLAWRRHAPRHTVARCAAWGLIAAGVVPAAAGLGAEIGSVVALLLPGLVAVAVVLGGAERRPPRATLRPRRPLAWPTAATLGREGARAALLLGLCPLVAGALALALARLTTTSDNDALAVVLVGFSVLWGGLATAAAMARRPLRAGAGVLLLGLLTIPVLA